MVKTFTMDKDGKISFTQEELKSLLDECYWAGYGYSVGPKTWVYTTPSFYQGDQWNQKWTVSTTASNMTPIEVNQKDSDHITIKC